MLVNQSISKIVLTRPRYDKARWSFYFVVININYFIIHNKKPLMTDVQWKKCPVEKMPNRKKIVLFYRTLLWKSRCPLYISPQLQVMEQSFFPTIVLRFTCKLNPFAKVLETFGKSTWEWGKFMQEVIGHEYEPESNTLTWSLLYIAIDHKKLINTTDLKFKA